MARPLLDRSKRPSRNRYENKKPEPRQLVRKAPNYDAAISNYDFASVLRLLMGIVCSAGIILLLVMCFVYSYRYLTTSSYFTIKEVKVNGNSHFSRESVLKTAGINEGMNSLIINIADVERALRNTPWVADVSVKRYLPDRFNISITERLPVFWVHKNDNLLYADSKGNLIAPVEADNFLSLPTLELDHGGEVLMNQLENFVEALRNTNLPLEIGTASWVRLSAARGFELYLEKHKLTISIGKDDWQANLHRMGLVLNDLARRGEIKSAAEIWANDGNVWVLESK